MAASSLLGALGPGSPACRRAVAGLWGARGAAGAAARFEAWRELCAPTGALRRLATAAIGPHLAGCGLPADAAPDQALFALHTYHALACARLDARLAGGAPDVPPPFDWPAPAATPALAAGLRDLARAAATVAWPAPGPGPTDVVQPLYEALVPKPLRHALGEFYTPRWLCEHALDAAGYTGAAVLAGALCDPTCGAGAFLLPAIARYRAAAAAAGWDAPRTLAGLLASVRGGDLNPLAVLGARLNYRLAIRDLAAAAGAPVAIPVAPADALAPPPDLVPARWVVGNPPWVRWSELPAAYRARAAAVARAYRVLPAARFFGGSELDVSGLVLVVAADRWLAPGGALAFVLPRSLYQAPAAAALRAFRLPDGTPLGVRGVDDWTAAAAFPGVANEPTTLVLTKGTATCYPVPYRVWRRTRGRGGRAPDRAWAAAPDGLAATASTATPVGPDGRWAILAPGAARAAAALAGPDPRHRGRKGVTCDLNGAYFVRPTGAAAPAGLVWVRNDGAAGRTAVPARDFLVERALVHPLLKGAAEIAPFRVADGGRAVLVPNRTITGVPPAAAFAAAHPHAAAYFAGLAGLLARRSTYRTRLAPAGAPAHAIYNVGDYTFAPHKVVWAEQARTLAAAVAGPRRLAHVGVRPVVPDHKVFFVACAGAEAAHYLCALLNSPAITAAADSVTAKRQVGALFRHLRLPPFDPRAPAHRALARFSRAAHAAGGAFDPARLAALAARVLDG
ncbi:MAG TPA: hypothetical protein VGQ83_03230 [Polyangia bacterium]